MRVCIALFGLNRSLPWTSKSIQEMLIDPLKQYGAQVKLYGFFNTPRQIHNPRTGESLFSFKNPGIDLLQFNEIMMVPQENEETDSLLSRFKGHDLQNNDATTTNTHRNLINQYRSLHGVMAMIESAEKPAPDAVLFARPDLEYLDRLDCPQALPMLLDGEFDMLTPTWSRWGGLNDRISLCNWRAARVYADRLSILHEIVAQSTPMNAEKILLWAARKSLLRNGDLLIRASRVRATGYTVDEGFSLDWSTQLRFLKRRVVSKIRRITSRYVSR